MKNFVIIPARAGSKSIKNKNLLKLGGTSLVDRAVAFAYSYFRPENIILSTDIPLFLEMKNTIFKIRERPERFCTDEALMIDTVKDVIFYYKLAPKDRVWLFQPTSPFRRIKDLVNIEYIFNKYRPQSLISVTAVQDLHPNRCYTVKNHSLYPLRHTNFENKQSLLPVYIRNGAFYVSTVDNIVQDNSFFTPNCFAYEMEKEFSINIDGPLDYEMAKVVYPIIRGKL